jgi:hypothetical protein
MATLPAASRHLSTPPRRLGALTATSAKRRKAAIRVMRFLYEVLVAPRATFLMDAPSGQPISCAAQSRQCQTRDGCRCLIRDREDRTEVDLAQDVAVFA